MNSPGSSRADCRRHQGPLLPARGFEALPPPGLSSGRHSRQQPLLTPQSRCTCQSPADLSGASGRGQSLPHQRAYEQQGHGPRDAGGGARGPAPRVYGARSDPPRCLGPERALPGHRPPTSTHLGPQGLARISLFKQTAAFMLTQRRAVAFRRHTGCVLSASSPAPAAAPGVWPFRVCAPRTNEQIGRQMKTARTGTPVASPLYSCASLPGNPESRRRPCPCKVTHNSRRYLGQAQEPVTMAPCTRARGSAGEGLRAAVAAVLGRDCVARALAPPRPVVGDGTA